MPSGYQNLSRAPVLSGLLLVTGPREFFTDGPPAAPVVWRHLLAVSLAASVLGGFSITLAATVAGALVLFVNAVGMTCIFTGCVFVALRIMAGRTLSVGRIFSISACASLGPIVISWIPGAMWVAEPWRWWVTAVGLSSVAPCGMKRAASTVAGAVVMMYGLFWIVLSSM